MPDYLRDPKTGLPLRHPRTGRIIVPDGYTRRGTPIWPMLGAEDPPPSDDPPEDPPPAGTTFTQAQLNAIVKRETGKTGQTAIAKLLKDLGVESPEALKTALKAKQDAEDKDKSDAQKATDAATKSQREAEQAKQEAKVERFKTQAERALVRAKLALPDPENDKDGTKAEQALSRAVGLLAVSPDADADAIKADVATLKELYPALFAQVEEKTPAKHTVPGKAGQKTPPQGGLTRGLQRAKEEAGALDEVRAKMYPGSVPAGTTT